MLRKVNQINQLFFTSGGKFDQEMTMTIARCHGPKNSLSRATLQWSNQITKNEVLLKKPNGVRENDTQDLKVTMKVNRKNLTWQK